MSRECFLLLGAMVENDGLAILQNQNQMSKKQQTNKNNRIIIIIF